MSPNFFVIKSFIQLVLLPDQALFILVSVIFIPVAMRLVETVTMAVCQTLARSLTRQYFGPPLAQSNAA